MTLNEYQMQAMSTRMDTCDNYTYMAEGLVGEVGEFMGKVAKAIRKGYATIEDSQLKIWEDRCTEEEKREICIGMLYELGDILWFVAGLARNMNISLETIAQMNIDKLSSRKERGVIEGDGDNR